MKGYRLAHRKAAEYAGVQQGSLLNLPNWATIPYFAIPNTGLTLIAEQEITIHGDSLINYPVVGLQIGDELTVEYTCNIGTTSGNNYVLNPTIADIGNHELTISFKTGTVTFLMQNISFSVISKSLGGSLKVLAVGDSTVAGNIEYWGAQVEYRLSNNVITWLGTKGTTRKNEGVAGYKYEYFALDDAYVSPFIKGGVIDIPAYFTDNSIDTPDVVYFKLGVNDMIDYADGELTDANLNTIKGYAQSLIDGFLSYNANIKIIVGLPTICTATNTFWDAAYDESVLLQDSYIEYIHRFWKMLTDNFANGVYNSRVNVSYEAIGLNRSTGYQDALHPNVLGNQMIGDLLAPSYNSLITTELSNIEGSTAISTIIGGTGAVYSIQGGTDAAKFAINSSTGVLTFVSAQSLATPTDTNSDGIYEVTVRYVNGTLTVNQSVKVTVKTKDFIVPFIATGTGDGVAKLDFIINADTTLTIDGTGKFYTDAAGTLGESTSKNITTSGTQRVYIRLASGTCNVTVSDGKNKVTQIPSYESITNAPKISTLNVKDFPIVLTKIDLFGSNDITGYIKDIPKTLTYFSARGSAIIKGYIDDMPRGVTFWNCYGTGNYSGNIANLPPVLITIIFQGSAIPFGDIAEIPDTVTTFSSLGSFPVNITGDLAQLPDAITTFRCELCQISNYTQGKNWNDAMNYVRVNPYGAGYGLSDDEVANLIIDIDSSSPWSGASRTLYLVGTNEAPAASSELTAALASLTDKSVTVTTN